MISQVLGLVGLCAVVLAGCDADAGEPTTLPDVTPSPSVSVASPDPSPSPSPTLTVEPPVEAADAHDYSEEGVEAFTLYAIDVINYAYRTNDVTYLEQIMTPDCQTCANTVTNIATLTSEQKRVEGGQIVVERISSQQPAEGVRPGSVVDVIMTASQTVDHVGNATDARPEESLQIVFFLAWEGSRWKLDGVTFGADG